MDLFTSKCPSFQGSDQSFGRHMALGLQDFLVAPLRTRTPDLPTLPCFAHITSAHPKMDFPPSQPHFALVLV